VKEHLPHPKKFIDNKLRSVKRRVLIKALFGHIIFVVIVAVVCLVIYACLGIKALRSAALLAGVGGAGYVLWLLVSLCCHKEKRESLKRFIFYEDDEDAS
jgi:hypothetical protein